MQMKKPRTISMYSSIQASAQKVVDETHSYSPKNQTNNSFMKSFEPSLEERSRSQSKGRVVFEATAKPPMSITHQHSHAAKKRFSISPYDIDHEVSEPDLNDLDPNDLAVNVILDPVKPEYKLIAR